MDCIQFTKRNAPYVVDMPDSRIDFVRIAALEWMEGINDGQPREVQILLQGYIHQGRAKFDAYVSASDIRGYITRRTHQQNREILCAVTKTVLPCVWCRSGWRYRW